MSEAQESGPPEHNLTGIDFRERSHLRYAGPPLIDVHAHVTLTRTESGLDLADAETMMDVAEEFGVDRVWTMCPVEHVLPLRDRFGRRIAFNAYITKKLDEPEEVAYRLLDRFLEVGVGIVKFWAAPRGRPEGLFVDAPWRIESARRALAAGVRVFMVHVADPDTWFRDVYTDPVKYGTKAEQYVRLERMLQMFPEATWIAAHMGGDPEHPEHLEELLERYPYLHYDTSATKWQVREVSPRREEIRSLVCRHPTRFLFGSDLVTRRGLPRDHYVSRYWCQRTLWESDWEGTSPIDDPDWDLQSGPSSPPLRGIALPEDVLELVYSGNAHRLLPV